MVNTFDAESWNEDILVRIIYAWKKQRIFVWAVQFSTLVQVENLKKIHHVQINDHLISRPLLEKEKGSFIGYT